MRKIVYTGQFKKDLKLMKKRHYDMEKLKELLRKLEKGLKLEPHYEDHPLQGNFSPARDCHISPDWILIYALIDDELRLIRTGTHSDLFR
jgi:mRNA interferase YafQ